MKKWILRIGLELWLLCSVYTFSVSFLPGPQGLPGEKGDTGATGLWGLRGRQGEKGERGYSVDLSKLYKQVSPAVVWIGAEYNDDEFTGATWKEISEHDENIPITVKWQGTGFFVTPCLIALAGHVVEDTKTFIVQYQDGTRAKADIIHMENVERCDVGFIQLRKKYRKERSYFKFDFIQASMKKGRPPQADDLLKMHIEVS